MNKQHQKDKRNRQEKVVEKFKAGFKPCTQKFEIDNLKILRACWNSRPTKTQASIQTNRVGNKSINQRSSQQAHLNSGGLRFEDLSARKPLLVHSKIRSSVPEWQEEAVVERKAWRSMFAVCYNPFRRHSKHLKVDGQVWWSQNLTFFG